MIFRSAALSGALLALLAAPAVAAGWSDPFRLSAPRAADLGPAQVALSPAGEIAVAFTVFDEDTPARAEALLAVRSPRGHLEPARRVPGAKAVLDLAFSGARLELLTGAAPPSLQCCSRAAVLSYRAGAFAARHALSSPLTGVTIGRLVVAPGAGAEPLAAVATDRAVWDARWRAGTGPGRTRRLSARAEVPWTLAGAQTATGQSALGWIEAGERSGEQGARRIAVALGSPASAPHTARVLFTAAAGHELDELAMAPGATGISLAWTDGWFDRGGAYRSEAVVADLAGKLQPKPLPVRGQTASGLVLAGGGAGEQVLAFRSCDASGACWVRAAFRDPRGRFGAPVSLGATDPGQEPDAAIAADGSATVGWIDHGHVFAVTRAPRTSRPGAVREVSGTAYASDLRIVAGAGLQAVAVWTQGTLNPSVVGALLRG